MLSYYNMKRSRVDGVDEVEALAMANCLMLLSRVGKSESTNQLPGRVFECKTCNRKFPSFQALGGHRASHKKPRLMGDELQLPTSPAKPKTHECSICGLEFAIGQALGGHMRRHRSEIHNPTPVSVVKKTSDERVLSLDLDLNLTPWENDLKIQFRKVPHMVDCIL